MACFLLTYDGDRTLIPQPCGKSTRNSYLPAVVGNRPTLPGLGRGQIRQPAIEDLRPAHLETLPTALAQGDLSLMAER